MSLDTALGIISLVLGITSLVTGYIFYRISLRIREPLYYIVSNNLIEEKISASAHFRQHTNSGVRPL